MASVVQKLVRKSLPTRVITALNNKRQASNLLIHHPHVGETKTVWADSVKKKRKRKMNKHKYKKLRKRLQRQT